ncbi:putative oxidoreductase YfjR-like protein [Cladobotryum mycophilum]|uniref:Oxidoreductase YfjR-like protein n=1 Tax=Cladobotryum mycophilum TaxID=491253 RepID=A0ABR0T184_9HYPO
MAPIVLWVGLGNMGRGMCKNIVEKGPQEAPLLIYNRSKQRAVDLSAKLASGKTEVVESLSDAVAKANIIFTCLANDEAVKEVHEIMLKNDVEGKVFVESSTIHPDITETLAKAAIAKGQLIGVLAGPTSSVEKVRPWFKGVTSRAEIDLSDQPYSKAATLKLLGNTFVLNTVEQLAEVHVVAEKSGLGTQPVHQLIESLFPGLYSTYSTRMLSGDYHKREEPLFAVDLARKDARHARSLAKSVGVALHNVETADAHLAVVKEHVGSSGDIAAIYGAVRKEAGLPFENEGY